MPMLQPSRKSLVLAWLIMMVLSVGTMISGRVSDKGSLGMWFMALLLLVTALKALWILRTYLNLRAAPTAWNMAFISFLFVLLALIYGLYLAGLSQ